MTRPRASRAAPKGPAAVSAAEHFMEVRRNGRYHDLIALIQFGKSAEPASTGLTSVTATLPAAITAGNRPIAWGAWQVGEDGGDEDGWTNLGVGGHSGPTTRIRSAWRDNDDDPSHTFSWTTGSQPGAVIVEVGTPEEIKASEDPVVRQFITGSLEGPIEVIS